jgi:uncharacterized protein YozE (UPF0346 family)
MLFKIQHDLIDIDRQQYLMPDDSRTRGKNRFYQFKIKKRVLFHCKPVNQQKTSIFALILWEDEYYGVNPKTNRWICSFLENRKQSVILEGTVSKQEQKAECNT